MWKQMTTNILPREGVISFVSFGSKKVLYNRWSNPYYFREKNGTKLKKQTFNNFIVWMIPDFISNLNKNTLYLIKTISVGDRYLHKFIKCTDV